MQVLVAYASRHGSTQQVAEWIADRLEGLGHDVDVRDAGTLRTLPGAYQLVVLGGALYSGRWHSEARRFLKRNRAELSEVPVAVFGMGPRRGDAEAWVRSRSQLDHALARYGWLVPMAVAVFGGVDPKAKPGQAARDLRDWDAIGAWVDGLEQVQPRPESP